MLEQFHLNNTKEYCNRFMAVYTRRYDEKSGLRAPNVDEAECAGKDAQTEIERLSQSGPGPTAEDV